MTEWGVVAVIVTLVGLLITIMTPILKLNTSITKLNTTIQNLDDLVDESRRKQEVHEAASAKKFEDIDHKITEHDFKIKNLERVVFKKTKEE